MDEPKRKASLMALIKANKVFLREYWKHGKVFIFLQVLLIGSNAILTLLKAYAPKWFLDAIIVDSNYKKALIAILLWVVYEFFHTQATKYASIYGKVIVSKANLKAKEYTYEKFSKLYLAYFEDPQEQNNIYRALGYINNSGEAIIGYIINFVNSIASLATMTYISITFDWWLAIIIISLFVLRTIIGKWNKRRAFEFNRKNTLIDRKMGYYSGVITQKDNLGEIKLYDCASFFFNKFKVEYIEKRKMLTKYNIQNILISLCEIIPFSSFNVFSYAYIGYKLIKNAATVGDYTLFFSVIGRINHHLQTVSNLYTELYSQMLEAQNYWDFMGNESHLMELKSTMRELKEPIQSIEFKNVSFKYPGQNRYALYNVSFKINAGEKISIVGFNGAGKTTLIKLMMLLYHPESGEILLNDRPIEEYNFKDYWKKIGVVFQRHNEYALSIAENIVLKEYSDDMESWLWDILTKVEMSDKIENLPNQLDSSLTRMFDSEGIELSGGERQTLSLARVYAKESELLIFDEPSSALDPIAEDMLYENVYREAKDKTILSISHRMSSVLYSDRIMFFDKGNLVEDGTHQELMQSCKSYREMFEKQANKYTRGIR